MSTISDGDLKLIKPQTGDNIGQTINDLASNFEKIDNDVTDKGADLEEVSQQIENKADKTQPSWINATLQNGWTGSFDYRKNTLGQVEYYFTLSPGTITAGTVIAAVATGYHAIVLTAVTAYNSLDGTLGYTLLIGVDGKITVRSGGNIEAGKKYRGSGVYIC